MTDGRKKVADSARASRRPGGFASDGVHRNGNQKGKKLSGLLVSLGEKHSRKRGKCSNAQANIAITQRSEN